MFLVFMNCVCVCFKEKKYRYKYTKRNGEREGMR